MRNVLVMLRHGQSQWNLENRFTGFHNVQITDQGREEAINAGKLIGSKGYVFDAVYTSTLDRAIETTKLVLDNAGNHNDHLKDASAPAEQGGWAMLQHEDLRERDYGDLTGLNKAETAKKFGDEQVHIWRRSYDIPPPNGESLKNVVDDRVGPYFNAEIIPQLTGGKNILLGAHGNTLRALLIILGVKTPENINEAEIPTGAPIVFEFEEGKLVNHYNL